MAVADFPVFRKGQSGIPSEKYGYPLRIFTSSSKLDDKYLCSHCHLVLRDPMQSFCGHRYCKNCVQQFDNETQCPLCLKEEAEDEPSLLSMETMFPDNAIRRDLNRMDVMCPNEGCTWRGKYKDLMAHEAKCDFEQILCPKQCGQSILLKDVKRHVDMSCPMRTIKCKNCGAETTANEIERHLEVCPKVKEKCQFCCKDVFRDRMAEHQEAGPPDCTQQYASCPFGCKDLIKSDNLQSHNKKCVVQHLDALLERVVTLHGTPSESTDSGASGGATAHAPRDNKVTLNRVAEVEKSLGQLQQRVSIVVSSSKTGGYFSSAPSKGATGGNFSLPSGSKHGDVNSKVSVIESKMTSFKGIVSVLKKDIELCGKVIETHDSQRRREKDEVVKMEKKVKELERTLALKDVALAEQDLRLQALELVSYDGVLIWKIKDFSRRKAEAQQGRTASLYSPCFYTGPYGYKMCARLYPNGDGNGKNTHVSLFFVVMRGEYDALCRWPFKQRVTLMILDQENREHLIDAFRPDETSSSFKRPTTEMNIASGCPIFSPYTKLLESKHRYLKDDCLFVKVIVDTTGL